MSAEIQKPKSLILHLSHSSCTHDSEGLKAAKASVELNQSAFLLMTSCLQLDSLLKRARRCLGPGLEGCPPYYCHLTSLRGIQEPSVPSATISDKTRTFSKSLTRNYSQLVQNVYEACPCSSLIFHLFNIYES